MKGNETGRKAGPQGSETALKITAISLLPMGRLDYLPEENDDLTKTLNQLWSAAVRRRWWILLPACGVALGTILVSILLPNRYRSEATILVEPQKVPERYVVANTTLDADSGARWARFRDPSGQHSEINPVTIPG